MKRFITRYPHLCGCVTICVIFALDQLSKYYVLYGMDLPRRGTVAILPVLNFTMVWNHAITFGLLQNHWAYGPAVFSVIALMVCIGLMIWMYRSRHLITSICLGSIIGGALGNICDRVHYGAVVDFIHLHLAGYSWYVFNLADSAIVCAVCVLMVVNVAKNNEQD